MDNREDARPPSYDAAADVAFMREHYSSLQRSYGILNPPPGAVTLDLELGAALATAVNDRQGPSGSTPSRACAPRS
jgi:hypothetical protein